MLQVKNISKTYHTGDLTQVALNNVSLNLRDNEFVAILGPSGSGKTTLLNIIGGLDRYDTGDLVINNISTKKYKDRDWDSYRNHTIGFVFQSYNLIPHQTVLANVELALTIGGISAKERRRRAIKALEQVGLKEQLHKKPNQMSGGQMQRVAIARALVNNPDILLADEPTGALDSTTSIQVMDLLKEVAKDRLVVMVTHNPELANQYANRIVKLKDGQIISDSNPYIVNNTDKIVHKKFSRASMNFLTALSLSFNNLLTKKGRTILTAFAGSIGIIGIALILSLSTGFQNYIDKIQEDTLTSYPLTITSETADATGAILSMVSDRHENKAEGENVIERQYLTKMFSAIGTNDLKTFKKFLEDNESAINKDVSLIKYSYSISPLIYTIDVTDTVTKLNPSSILSSMYSSSSNSVLSSLSSGSRGIFSEIEDDIDSFASNYDVLKGRWPEKYNEMVVVLSEPNSISDLLIYSLGLRDTKELKTIMTSLMSKEEVEIDNKPLTITYDDLLNVKLKLIKPADLYKYNSKYSIYEDMSNDEEYMKQLYNDSLDLNIVGVVCRKDSSSSNALSAGVAYTRDLTDYVISTAYQTDIVKKQLTSKSIDVFSGKRFDEENNTKEELNFQDMIKVDEDALKEAFTLNVDFTKLTNFDSLPDTISKSVLTLKDGLNYDVFSFKQIEDILIPMFSKTVINAYISQNTSGEEGFETVDFSNIDTFKESYYSSSEYLSLFEAPPLSIMLSMYHIEPTVVTMLIKTPCNLLLDLYTQACLDGKTGTTISLTEITNVNGFLETKLSDVSVTNSINSTIVDLIRNMNALIIANEITSLSTELLSPIKDAFPSDGQEVMSIDTDKFADAFKFDMDQDELSRIMSSMMSKSNDKTYSSNLINLGYQDKDDPTSISFFFKDFESKENFVALLDEYNDKADEDHQIRYTDITGLLMSSVKKIVDSVSYVLIAFVSISLVVSSIMIAVITLISVMERTKEIGILRAMGASKRNVSSIFNAETFIIGLLSGLLGIGVTLLSIPPINTLIHNLTDNYDINAKLPTDSAIILIIISVVLTIFAGIIPSRKASKQDPVIALRSE